MSTTASRMRVTPGEGTIDGAVSSLEPRAWRALGAVGLAVLVVVVVGMAYLRPWQLLAPAPPPPVKPQPAATVQEMQFLSANLGWVVAENSGSSALFHTADGGRHWQRRLQVLGSM